MTDSVAPRRAALAVLCAGALMMIIDETVVNVALRTIQRDLEFTQASLAWVLNAYLIAFGGLLLLAGRLGDLLGRKRVFITGLAVFTAASLLCGLAQSQGMLIAARALQGAGAALTSAVILGMVVALFPEPREQARAIGVFSFTQASGGSIGLLAGGAITQAINWHWIFFVNVPIGIAAALLAVRLLSSERGLGLAAGADVAGALLVTAAPVLGVYAIVGTTEHGWGSPRTLVFGGLALALLAAFVAREATAATPLMPLQIFRSRTVRGANLVLALLVGAMFGWLFLGSLYLQRVLGYDALETGLANLPIALVIGALSLFVTPRLVARFGARSVLVPGLVSIAAAFVLLTRVPVDATYAADVLPAVLLFGLGGGLALPAVMMLAMSGATASDSGLTSGLLSTSQQVGGALGLSVLATLATSRSEGLRAGGETGAAALTGGYTLAFAVAAGLLGAATLVALAVLRPQRSAGLSGQLAEPVT
jgi:EmrB/QacA subfamily drug resistance transporter